MATVYRATVNLDAFDFTMLYAYTQVNGADHAERCHNADKFAANLASRDLDIQTIRTILEAHGIPLPEGDVAIKLANSAVDEARFHSEWRNLVCLHHDNVIQVYGGGTHGEAPYYAMEVLPSIIEPEQIQSRFSLRQKLEFIRQAAGGLDYLHSNGIIHRDVKPDNLIACSLDPSRFVVKVTDLGIAKNSDSSMQMTMTNTVMGTPSFMSPEQAKSSRDVDRRADVYSLGATFYWLMCGKVPYAEASSIYEVIGSITQGTPPTPIHGLVDDLPKPVQQIIECSMAFDPDDRYPSMSELIEDIERYLVLEGGGFPAAPALELGADQATLVAGDLHSPTLSDAGAVGGDLGSQATVMGGVTPDAATLAATTRAEYNFETITLAATQRQIAKEEAKEPEPEPVSARPAWLLPVLGGAAALAVAGGAYLLLAPAEEVVPPAPAKLPAKVVPPPKDGSVEVDRAKFKTLFAQLKALETSESVEKLEEARGIGKQMLRMVQSDLEEEAVRDLLDKIARKRRDLEAGQRYGRQAVMAKGYLQEGKYAEAIKAAEAALEHQRSPEMEKLIFAAKRQQGLHDTYTKAMAQGGEHLLKKNWTGALKAFRAAARVDGFTKDAAAATGIHDALKGEHLQHLETGLKRLNEKRWKDAEQALESARKVQGYEKNAEVLKALARLVTLQKQAGEADVFQRHLKTAEAEKRAGRLEKAEEALVLALAVPGFAADEAATQRLTGIRRERFDTALALAQKHLKAERWDPACEAFRAAVAVAGYEKHEGAVRGLAKAVQGQRDADWSSGPPPMPMPAIQAAGGGSTKRVQRSVPDLTPEEPEMFGLFRP
jgi:tetratricopeptide (TPR) repeat protein